MLTAAVEALVVPCRFHIQKVNLFFKIIQPKEEQNKIVENKHRLVVSKMSAIVSIPNQTKSAYQTKNRMFLEFIGSVCEHISNNKFN